MKTIWPIAVTAFLLKCVTTLSVSAQGSMTYISSLNRPSGGSVPIASDSWFAQGFSTGTNALGYSVEAVSLLMANAPGNPSGFTVSLYTRENLFPGSRVGTLSSSLDPVLAGVSSFTPIEPIILAPATGYFVVVTASQPLSSGSYRWSHVAPSTNSSVDVFDGWRMGTTGQSSDGFTWERVGNVGAFQFSIGAAAVPEPSTFLLLAFGTGAFGCRLFFRFTGRDWKALLKPSRIRSGLPGGTAMLIVLSAVSLHAQGTTYFSNLGSTPQGASAIGSNSWLAQSFMTGGDLEGYRLDSVVLAMDAAFGNSSGFRAFVYDDIGANPGTSVGLLTGSMHPSGPGSFLYAGEGLVLSPSTTYWIVLRVRAKITSDFGGSATWPDARRKAGAYPCDL